jgi:hypothetical protein
MHPVGVVPPRPPQQLTCAQLRQLAPSQPLGHARPLVLGDRSPKVPQQQLVVGIVAHGPLHERDPHPPSLHLLEEEHLVEVLARQAIRGRDEEHVPLGQCGGVAQAVQPWSTEAGAAVAVVTVDPRRAQVPGLQLDVLPRALHVVLDRLVLRLPSAGDTGRDRGSHH